MDSNNIIADLEQLLSLTERVISGVANRIAVSANKMDRLFIVRADLTALTVLHNQHSHLVTYVMQLRNTSNID